MRWSPFDHPNKDIHGNSVPMDTVNVKVQAVSTRLARLAHNHASVRLSRAPMVNRVSDCVCCRQLVVLRTLGVASRDAVADAVPAGRCSTAQLPRRLLALRRGFLAPVVIRVLALSSSGEKCVNTRHGFLPLLLVVQDIVVKRYPGKKFSIFTGFSSTLIGFFSIFTGFFSMYVSITLKRSRLFCDCSVVCLQLRFLKIMIFGD